MKKDHVKKQLEANLETNFSRILKSYAEDHGPIVLSWAALFKSALIAAAVILAVGGVFRLPDSPWAVIFIFVILSCIALNFVGRTGGSEKEFDAFGNEIDESNIYGSGRRMTDEQKRRYLEIFREDDPKGTILGKDPKLRQCLGIPDKDRSFHESLDHRHLFVIGASGRGKSKYLKDRHRQLIMQKMTDIYIDPKGEHTEDVVYPCADAMGYKNKWLFRFRTEDIHLSNRFDLLKDIRSATYPGVKAHSLASIILGFKEDANSSDYWSDSAIGLLTLSLLAAARCEPYFSIDTFLSTGDSYYSDPDGKGTWKTAARVFDFSASEVERYFKALMDASDYNTELLRKYYNMWVGDERNYRGHVSSVGKKISVLAERGVAEMFSEDEVDFDTLVTEPSTLGLIYSPGDHGYFSSAMNLVIQLAVDAIMRNMDSPQKRALVLEEMKVTGVIDRFDELLSFLRGYNTQIIGCVQSYTQLKALYGEDTANSFFQNAHIVFMGGQEPETLKKMEDLTGTQGLMREYSSSSVGGGSVRVTEGDDVVSSAVVGRTELLYMEKGRLFVKLSNCGPVILDAYDSNKHPLAHVRYIDRATGRFHKLKLKELLPGFDPERSGLKLVGVPPEIRPGAGEEEAEKRPHEEDYYMAKEEF